jgi:hypothetical protein
MDNTLQRAHLTATADQATVSMPVESPEALEQVEEAESHIHLPNPSFWPLFLGAALLICLASILVINTLPWITIIALVLVLISIMGWALEDPMAPLEGRGQSTAGVVTSYAEAIATGRPTPLAAAVLRDAEGVVERTVTVSSSEWSAHSVSVEVEQEGVVLALYGKVELEAQRERLAAELLKLPGVIDVRNFLVAEDTILNAVNARIEKLRAAGKLEGAKNISVLVENYIVNLYGEVPTNEMKYRLERELLSVPGVRVVVNRINLGDIPGELGKTRNK